MVYVSYIVETAAENANNKNKYMPLALTLLCVEIAVHVVLEVYERDWYLSGGRSDSKCEPLAAIFNTAGRRHMFDRTSVRPNDHRPT